MKKQILHLSFNGRKPLDIYRKRIRYGSGIIFLLYGLWGAYRIDFHPNLSSYIFGIGGLLHILYAIYGKKLIKEKNFIKVTEDEISYKNSFKPKKLITIDNLMDVRIETTKVEFVFNNQNIEWYDFSVFQEEELKAIYKTLKNVKAKLIK
ncbi:hypothetical protein EMN47_12855 [Prolixibacteraceae bacterium JC049]|nr:hypothetical protein [Prolixibacteraceae bacterium JC049]